MFNPHNVEAILQLDDTAFSLFPAAEDDSHEYKSSTTKDDDLGTKIERAASAFWNSGGGLFVAGVNGNGQPDGGITLAVGPKARQSRRDWVDQKVARVTPRGHYVVKCIESQSGGVNIQPACAVILIGFAPSEVGPHMAPDNRYYIRAGAHTVRASHFIVESIWARRHFARPRLVHMLYYGNYTTETSHLIIDLTCVTTAPALDVSINLDPPPERSMALPVTPTLIDPAHPFTLWVEIKRASGYRGVLSVDYSDLGGTRYNYRRDIDSEACFPKSNRPDYELSRIRAAVEEIGRTLSSQALR